MEQVEHTNSLLEGKPIEEQAAIIGRFLVLREVDLGFTDYQNRQIARLDLFEKTRAGNYYPLSFKRGILKTWVGKFGDSRGLDWAEIEIAAEMLDQFDTIWPFARSSDDKERQSIFHLAQTKFPEEL